MSYRAATCNAHAPSNAQKNTTTIRMAAARTDVLCVQEADREVVNAILALAGFVAYLASGIGARNPIAWREHQFELITSGWSRIMRNLPGKKDGPDRSMVWVVLREIATGRKVIHINVHLIHQAFTSNKWRRPQWYASLAVLGVKAAILLVRHRCPIVFSGDWNNPGKFNIPHVDEREVPSPATHGDRRYDRFLIVGAATASKVDDVDTPSDHDTLIATITLLPQSGTKPAPVPAPKPVPKPAPPKEAPVVGMLTNLDDVVRSSGLIVKEIPGWKSRRSGGGENYQGVGLHHTGSYDALTDATNDYDYAKWMATEGRPDLDPPLCNLALSAEGVVYVCAAGNANGMGQVKATGPMPAARDGNALYVVIEAMNSGSQGWESKGKDAAGNVITQREAYHRLTAAICRGYGWPASHVRAHYETSVTGKWDPGDPDGVPFKGHRVMDMTKFRAAVDRLITNPHQEDDDMPRYSEWKKEDREALAADVAKAVDRRKLMGMDDAPKGRFLGSAVSNIHNAVLRVEKAVRELTAEIRASKGGA